MIQQHFKVPLQSNPILCQHAIEEPGLEVLQQEVQVDLGAGGLLLEGGEETITKRGRPHLGTVPILAKMEP